MKEEEGISTQTTSQSSISDEGIMPFLDSNDPLTTFATVMPKVSENLPTGKSTYGMFEFLAYTDTLIYESWMAASQTGSMGLCGSLIIVSVASRLAFMPIQLYS